jgi:hypothetical protein
LGDLILTEAHKYGELQNRTSGKSVANKLRECRQIWRDVIANANNLVAETGLKKPSAPPSGGTTANAENISSIPVQHVRPLRATI